ncbi:MAG: ATP-binding protein [Pseudomonadota bacterium]
MQQKQEYKWALERFKKLHSPMEFLLLGLIGIAICLLFSSFDKSVDPYQFAGFAGTRWLSVGIWTVGIILFLKNKKQRFHVDKIFNFGLIFLYLGWSITNHKRPDSSYFQDVEITTLIVLITLFIANRMNTYFLMGLALLPLIIECIFFSGSDSVRLMEYLYDYPLNDKIAIGLGVALVIRHSTFKYLLAEIRYEKAVSSRDYLFNILQHDISNSLFIAGIRLNSFKTKNERFCEENDFKNVENSLDNTISIVNAAKRFHLSLGVGKETLRPISAIELVGLIRDFCEPIVQTKSQALDISIEGKEKSVFIVDFEPLIYNVIGNIVGNSSKFSPPHSTISLVVNTNSELYFSIRDQAGGFKEIPPETKGSSVEEILKKTGGQGLKIASETMKYLNGSIQVSNDGLGANVEVKVMN